MANKTLTAKVKFDTKSAEASLARLSRKINNVQNAIKKTSGNNTKLNTAINKAVTATNKLDKATQKVANTTNKVVSTAKKVNTANNQATQSANKLAKGYRSSNNAASGLLRTVKSLASTYLGIMGMKAILGTSDTITSTQNRLKNINGGNGELTQNQMDKMYTSANKVRMGYSDMLSNASKSMVLAGDAFQGDMDNAIRFQEIMAETYALGGASAAEMSSSMYQMIQALGSGTLAGDELRSVREGAPLAYKAIEEFAQGIYDTDASLKELASDGLVTSDMVVAAIMKAGDKIDAQFENTAVTFGQAWDRIKNSAIKAFEPVSNMLNQMLNQAVENGAFEKIETAFWNVSKALQIVFQVIYNAVVWIADNWNWLQHILIGGLILYASYLVITTGIAIAQAILRIVAWLKEYSTIFLIISAILALIYVFYLWKQSAIDTCQAVGIALLIIAVICFFIFGWVVALIVGIIGLVVMFFEYFCYLMGFLAAVVVDTLSIIWNIVAWVIQSIFTATVWLVVIIIDTILVLVNMVIAVLNTLLGIVLWLFATIYNNFVGVVNACLQAVWMFVEPFLGIIEFILNACNGGFNSFGGAVANLIGQIIGWFLSLGKVVTKIIDAIFGTNWTDGLNSLQDKVLSWGKNEKGITIEKNAPELSRIDATDAFKTGFEYGGYVDLINPNSVAGTAWNSMDGLHTGLVNPLDWGSASLDWGSGVMDSVNDWGSQFQNSGSNGSLLDKIGNKLGLDFSESVFPNANDPAFDVAGAYNQPTIEELLSGVADDTGAIKDSMDLSNEDLEYLRKIADMEWRNEFTTAEIRVDMTNNNTVNGERDLDGIVEYLSDVLRSEMTNVAYGVHY